MVKKFFSTILILFLLVFTITILFGCSEDVPEPSPNAKFSFLTVDGKTIKNEDKEIIRLRGTNSAGWLIQEDWMCPISEKCQIDTIKILTNRFGEEKMRELFDIYENNWWTMTDFDNIKKLGLNVIRLPFTYMNLTDSKGNIFERGFDKLQWFVDNCNEREIYVILDLHGAIGSQNGYDHSGDNHRAELFSNSQYMDATVELWKEIATRFRGNKAVAGYDLLNEPLNGFGTGTTGKAQWDFYDRLYKAIRQIDSEHIIFIEGMWGPKYLPDPKEYNWENVVYEFHNYFWRAEKYPEKQKSETLRVTRSYRNMTVPVLIGEFNPFGLTKSWDYVMEIYEEAGCNWTTWAYKISTDTLDAQNMWGLYCGASEKVNPSTDSFETIKEKWSAIQTDKHFVQNETLSNILKRYTK